MAHNIAIKPQVLSNFGNVLPVFAIENEPDETEKSVSVSLYGISQFSFPDVGKFAGHLCALAFEDFSDILFDQVDFILVGN